MINARTDGCADGFTDVKYKRVFAAGKIVADGHGAAGTREDD